MKTVFQHIEHIHGKPHHIRKQVAFSAAFAVAALIGLSWLVTSTASGAFALTESSFADASGQGVEVVDAKSPNQNLAGAAAAFSDEASAPARIEIVDTAPASGKKAEPTVIPF